MLPKKSTPRSDYRQRESQRSEDSATLTQKFPELKSLTVEYRYVRPDGSIQNRPIKFIVNPDFAKSVFRIDCPNDECVGGDFDLSEALAQAVAARRSTVAGEIRCKGWMSKTTIDRIRCNHGLRFELNLEYGPQAPAEDVQFGQGVRSHATDS